LCYNQEWTLHYRAALRTLQTETMRNKLMCSISSYPIFAYPVCQQQMRRAVHPALFYLCPLITDFTDSKSIKIAGKAYENIGQTGSPVCCLFSRGSRGAGGRKSIGIFFTFLNVNLQNASDNRKTFEAHKRDTFC